MLGNTILVQRKKFQSISKCGQFVYVLKINFLLKPFSFVTYKRYSDFHYSFFVIGQAFRFFLLLFVTGKILIYWNIGTFCMQKVSIISFHLIFLSSCKRDCMRWNMDCLFDHNILSCVFNQPSLIYYNLFNYEWLVFGYIVKYVFVQDSTRNEK